MEKKPLGMYSLLLDKRIMEKRFDANSILIAWNMAMACAGLEKNELRDSVHIDRTEINKEEHPLRWENWKVRDRTLPPFVLQVIMKSFQERATPEMLASDVLLDVVRLLRCALIFDEKMTIGDDLRSLCGLLFYLAQMEKEATHNQPDQFFSWLGVCIDCIEKMGITNPLLHPLLGEYVAMLNERIIWTQSTKKAAYSLQSPTNKAKVNDELRVLLSNHGVFSQNIKDIEYFFSSALNEESDKVGSCAEVSCCNVLGSDTLGKKEFSCKQIICEVRRMSFADMKAGYDWTSEEENKEEKNKKKEGKEDAQGSVDLEQILAGFRIPREAFELYVRLDRVSMWDISPTGGIAQKCILQLSLCYGFLHARLKYLNPHGWPLRVGRTYHVDTDYSLCWNTLLALSVWIVVAEEAQEGKMASSNQLIISKTCREEIGKHTLTYSVASVCRFCDLYSMPDNLQPSIFQAAAKMVRSHHEVDCMETDLRMISMRFEPEEAQLVACFVAFVTAEKMLGNSQGAWIQIPYEPEVISLKPRSSGLP